jgi:hypothetical protein
MGLLPLIRPRLTIALTALILAGATASEPGPIQLGPIEPGLLKLGDESEESERPCAKKAYR